MTIHYLQQTTSQLRLRYIPLLTWIFTGLSLYTIGAIIANVASGQRTLTSGVALAIVGLLAFTLFLYGTAGQFVICTFDTARNMMVLRRYGLLGYRKIERPLQDISQITVRVLRRSYNQIELGFKSGEAISLTPYYVVSFSTRMIERLSELLGVDVKMEPVSRIGVSNRW